MVGPRPVLRGRGLQGAVNGWRLRRLSITAIDIPQARAPSSVERWYVLGLMCLIYSINIADRYVVSTVLEPIRLELKLSDSGVAFLTGVSLAFFYVFCGLPMSLLVDRVNRTKIIAFCHAMRSL